jgi:cell division protein FtsB
VEINGGGDPVDRYDGSYILPVASEYGGLNGDQVKRLKELEAENTRLRRAVSDLTLDKMILAEAAKGNF